MLILEGIFSAFCDLLDRLDGTKDTKAWLRNFS